MTDNFHRLFSDDVRFTVPACQVIIAPTAAGLLFVATRCSPIQLFRFPPWLRSNNGGSPLFDVSTSASPSLSKSPSAMPRPENILLKTAPDVRADVLETTPGVLKHQQRFLVSHARNARFDHIVRMSIDKKQVRIAIIIVVEKLQPPAA